MIQFLMAWLGGVVGEGYRGCGNVCGKIGVLCCCGGLASLRIRMNQKLALLFTAPITQAILLTAPNQLGDVIHCSTTQAILLAGLATLGM